MYNLLNKSIKYITNMRINNARKLDNSLKTISGIILKKRNKNFKEVYHLYEFRIKNSKLRKSLVSYLIKNKIDAKIHYPVPMHLQPAAKIFKYKKLLECAFV